MYAIYYQGEYEIFDSLLEAEAFAEQVWNREGIKLDIELYYWWME